MDLRQKLLSFSRIGNESICKQLKEQLEIDSTSDRESLLRQIEILDLIGNSQRHLELDEVARKLNVSEKTLKHDMNQILKRIKKH